MKSITIHDLDNTLAQHIEEKAKGQGISLNQTIKKLLRESLGIAVNTAKARQSEFMDIFGAWSKKDEHAFNAKAKSLEHIDKEDWL